MNDHDHQHSDNHKSATPTQAELYESLRRIGELEDQKQSVQAEIDRRTNELRQALEHIDPDSLLFKMLDTALATDARARPAGRGTSSPKRRSSKRSAKNSGTAKSRA